MNEVKHIHLGRQQFTIALDAHKQLRDYLDAIAKQMAGEDSDVMNEIELRMAELLTERGITPQKVILPADVQFLKEQLGEPGDFQEESAGKGQQPTVDTDSPKRLFRDTQNGMVAGVASGLAAYFNIDAVIIRLIFLALVFAGGSGVIIYAIMWLIVPEAKTGSEQLQMRGRPVTVDALKDLVSKADVPGAARRVQSTAGSILEVIAKVILTVSGIAVAIIAGLCLVGIISAIMYLLFHGAMVAGDNFFPRGASEIWMTLTGGLAVIILLLLILLIGISMIRRKWQLPAWAVAALFGFFFVTAPISGALIASDAPGLHQRFDALHHIQTNRVASFGNVVLSGREAKFFFLPDSKYAVEYHYLGSKTIQRIKQSVTDNTLNIDTGDEAAKSLCGTVSICLYDHNDLSIYIHAPSLAGVTLNGDNVTFVSSGAFTQTDMNITVSPTSVALLNYIHPGVASVIANKDGTRTVHLTGLQADATSDDVLNVQGSGSIDITRTDELDVQTDETCRQDGAIIFAKNVTGKIVLNGQTFDSQANFMPQRSLRQTNAYNCVVVGESSSDFSDPVPETPDNVPFHG